MWNRKIDYYMAKLSCGQFVVLSVANHQMAEVIRNAFIRDLNDNFEQMLEKKNTIYFLKYIAEYLSLMKEDSSKYCYYYRKDMTDRPTIYQILTSRKIIGIRAQTIECAKILCYVLRVLFDGMPFLFETMRGVCMDPNNYSRLLVENPVAVRKEDLQLHDDDGSILFEPSDTKFFSKEQMIRILSDPQFIENYESFTHRINYLLKQVF